jgi:hypothetical protein
MRRRIGGQKDKAHLLLATLVAGAFGARRARLSTRAILYEVIVVVVVALVKIGVIGVFSLSRGLLRGVGTSVEGGSQLRAAR